MLTSASAIGFPEAEPLPVLSVGVYKRRSKQELPALGEPSANGAASAGNIDDAVDGEVASSETNEPTNVLEPYTANITGLRSGVNGQSMGECAYSITG